MNILCLSPALRYTAKPSLGSRLHTVTHVAAGQYVSQLQRIHDIDFVYQPPPKNVVPHAAALKSLQARSDSALLVQNTCKSHLQLAFSEYTLVQLHAV